jgi:hypothetical protein
MNRMAIWRRLPWFAVFAVSTSAVHAQNPGSSLPATAAASPFRSIRSVSGASGHEANGRFVMDDPRSLFTAGKDAKIIVYFEWEGPLGPHHFEALWKSPEGRIVLISDFRYEAKTKEFNGYWTMLLSDGSPAGEWSLEARIDGEFAGSHTFVVTTSPTVIAAAASPSRQPLTTSDLYKRVLEATVKVEKLAPDGSILDSSSGFWVANDMLLTAFESIDGASSLRIVFPDGTSASTEEVAAWNRWQDWALLLVPRKSGPFLKRASNSMNVGDHAVFLERDASGSRLTDGAISGKNTFPKSGDRLLIVSAASPASIGGPLLDDFGDYVAVLGGTTLPGATAMKMRELLQEGPANRSGGIIYDVGAMAVPISQIPEIADTSSKTSLKELERRGEFLPVVTRSGLIGYAQFAVVSGKGSNVLNTPHEYRSTFSRREGHAALVVNWQPIKKAKGKAVLRIFNAENMKIAESKPDNLTLSPGNLTGSSWNMAVGNLAPGIYRADLLFSDQTIWRDFFRLTD